MACVEDWTKQCLKPYSQKQYKQSVSGAHEMFTFLCRDPKFRADYLKHAECYKRISKPWDNCANSFIDGLKQLGNKADHLAVCW